jgi:hypothetical protein
MKKTLFFTMASVALLATSSVHAALNLVSDGNFTSVETGTILANSMPWYDPLGKAVINKSNPLPGQVWNAVMTTPTSTSDDFLIQNLNLTIGQGYTINFWLATPGGPGGTLTVTLNGALAQVVTVPSNSAYTEYNLNATANIVSSQLVLDWGSIGNSGAILDVDNVSVAVPEPTTMVAGALMLLPFAASTLRLRKKVSA